MEAPAPNQPERPSFSELDIRGELQIDLDEERDLLQALTLRGRVDEDLVIRLNEELPLATSPMSPGNSAEAREERGVVFEARDAVFSLLGLNNPRHKLHKTFRAAKQLSSGRDPSPAALIMNARLIKGMGAPITETLGQAERFLYVAPDVAGLDTLEATFKQYGLSMWEHPVLAAQPPRNVEPRLSHIQSLLIRLRLPITAAEVVLEDPTILRHAEERTSLLAGLAMAHASLRHYIRSPHQNLYKKQPSDRVSLRTRLARDIGNALNTYTLESHMLGILESETGDMGLAQSLLAKKEFGKVKEARDALLSRLSYDGVERIGPAIVESYFRQKPLTEGEWQKYPSLIPFAPLTETPPTPEESIRVRSIHIGDIFWLEKALGHEVEAINMWELIGGLHDSMIQGSRFLKSLDKSEGIHVLAERVAFFTKLGWLSPHHPVYERFMGAIELNRGIPPVPDNTVAILRLLAEPAGEQLLEVVSSTNFAVLRHHSAQWVERRLNAARHRAEQQGTTIEEVLKTHATWFVISKLPD